MKVKVIGKQHMEGTSKKSGNDYNINIVHFIAKDPQVNGFSANTVTLDGKTYPIESIILDSEYNLDYGPRGFVVGFERVVK